MLHARYASFVDRFHGEGQKWTVCNDSQCGGVAEETLITLVWGVTARL
jgi:hypothetical protein